MATSTMENTVLDINGVAVAGCEVTIDLIPGPGFKVDTGTEIAPRVAALTDVTGKWSIALERTANITPAGSYYRVKEQIPKARGGPKTWYFTVPTASPTTLLPNTINPNTASSVITPFVVTSGTRPAAPFVGQMIFETDTGKILFYYGSTLGWLPDWGVSWGEVAALSSTATPNSTSTSYVDATAQTISFTAINGRRYHTWLNAVLTLSGGSAGAQLAVAICDAANTVLNEKFIGFGSAPTAYSTDVSILARSPGNETGSVTRKIRFKILSGTGTVTLDGSGSHPNLLAAYDAGFAAAPVIT